MKIEFTEHAWEEFSEWVKSDKEVAGKITDLLNSIIQTPFNGLGKPEPLKYNLKGFWSRRITGEHRLVYQISGEKENQKCSVIQCKFHYDDKK